ncbi:MAG: GntR family transcriptional regulator [Armatimonadota bacterium]
MSKSRFDRNLKYEALRDLLKEAILRGEYLPGDRLPSESELSSKYGLSNPTVREAFAQLSHEGLVNRVQGKGTFVARVKPKLSNIAVVMPAITPGLVFSDVCSALLQYVAIEARENGTGAQLYLDNCRIEMERENLLDIAHRKPSGAIVFYMGGEQNLDCLQAIRDAGVPLVLIDRYVDSINCDYVVTDNFSGAYRAGKMLLDRGFERAFLFTEEINASSARDRVAGYKQALSAYNVGINETTVVDLTPLNYPDYDERAFEQVRRILKQSKDPVAILSVHRWVAPLVWTVVQEERIDPSRVGMACFDDPPGIYPSGTTLIEVIQPLDQIAARAVKIILNRLQGDTQIQKVVMEPEVRVVSDARSFSSATVDSQEPSEQASRLK